MDVGSDSGYYQTAISHWPFSRTLQPFSGLDELVESGPPFIAGPTRRNDVAWSAAVAVDWVRDRGRTRRQTCVTYAI